MQGSTDVSFSTARSNSELQYTYEISTSQKGENVDLQVGSYDACDDSLAAYVLLSKGAVTDRDGTTWSEIAMTGDIVTNALSTAPAGFYAAQGDNISKFKFCIRADIGAIAVVGQEADSSISFVKLKYEIDVNMETGFTTNISVVEELSNPETASVDVNYNRK